MSIARIKFIYKNFDLEKNKSFNLLYAIQIFSSKNNDDDENFVIEKFRKFISAKFNK